MSAIRRTISEYPRVAMALAAGGAALALWLMFTGGRPAARPHVQMDFFYDQNTGQLITLPAETQGPAATDSGLYQGAPAAVRAHVFACGICTKEARFVGWLEVSAAALEASGSTAPVSRGTSIASDDEEAEPTDALVRRPGDAVWVPLRSMEGRRVTDLAGRCADLSELRRCVAPTAPTR